MDLRTPVKHALRMCGHAMVSTIHERLNLIDQALRDLAYQHEHLASNQTALLQSEVYLVENMALLRAKLQQIEDRVEAQVAVLAEVRAAATGKVELEALDRQVAALRDEIPRVAERTAMRAGELAARSVQGLDQRIAVLQEVLDESANIARTQTALLQSGVHLVESMSLVHAEIHQVEEHLEAYARASGTDLQSLLTLMGELRREIPQVVERTAMQAGELAAARKAGLQDLDHRLAAVQQHSHDLLSAGLEQMLRMGEDMRNTATQSLARWEPLAEEARRFLADESVRQIAVETSDYLFNNPEIGLFSFLYSHLPSRIVLDIGANTGDFSTHLLQAGYEVYAFEPYPGSYLRLKQRLGAHPEFHALKFALGSAPGEVPLHTVEDHSLDQHYGDPTVYYSLARHGMPDDLPFTGSVSVTVKTLAQLHQEGAVPADVGLVKIDTEGHDLEVIRGMDNHRYPAVMVEFWDANIPFGSQGLPYTVGSMAAEMRQRGYFWYIVIYRVWGQNRTAFYCNRDQAVPHSWGNLVFFRDRETFAEAQQWCSAVLPRTYFKTVPSVAADSTQAALIASGG